MNAKSMFSNITVERSGISRIDEATYSKLDGLNLKQAIESGLIIDINPERILVPHKVYDQVYLVFDGKAVPVSDNAETGILNAAKAGKMLEFLAGCQFRSGVSTTPGEGFGKPWVRFGLAGELDLDLTKSVPVQATALKGA